MPLHTEYFRPLREIFVNKIVKQQLKMAEKALFVTKDKWEVFVNHNLVLTTATLDYDCLPVALGYDMQFLTLTEQDNEERKDTMFAPGLRQAT